MMDFIFHRTRNAFPTFELREENLSHFSKAHFHANCFDDAAVLGFTFGRLRHQGRSWRSWKLPSMAALRTWQFVGRQSYDRPEFLRRGLPWFLFESRCVPRSRFFPCSVRPAVSGQHELCLQQFPASGPLSHEGLTVLHWGSTFWRPVSLSGRPRSTRFSLTALIAQERFSSRIFGTRKNCPSVFGALDTAASRGKDGSRSSERKMFSPGTG